MNPTYTPNTPDPYSPRGVMSMAVVNIGDDSGYGIVVDIHDLDRDLPIVSTPTPSRPLERGTDHTLLQLIEVEIEPRLPSFIPPN